MASTEETTKQKVKISQKDLYREEIYTDLQTGVIRQLTPVKINAEIDKSRKIMYFGQTQLMTQQGPLPIQFPIDAKNLQQAAEKFPEAMEQFVTAMMEEAKRLQREEQSRIIVPSAVPPQSNLILK